MGSRVWELVGSINYLHERGGEMKIITEGQPVLDSASSLYESACCTCTAQYYVVYDIDQNPPEDE